MKGIGTFLLALLIAMAAIGLVVGYCLLIYALTKINHHDIALRITVMVSVALAPFGVWFAAAIANDWI